MARKKSDGPIATKIRERIKTTAPSYSYLAKEAKVSQSAISKFLAGQDIRLSTAERLLDVLDQGYVGATQAANKLEKLLDQQREQTAEEIRYFFKFYSDLPKVEESLRMLSQFIEHMKSELKEEGD